MQTLIESSNIDGILAALDRQIGVLGGTPLALAVCGGTALAALGLVDRTTKDVDVLGIVIEAKDSLIIQRITDFPGWLVEAATRVGRDFDLPPDWLNLGPAAQVESGVPEGFERRLVKKQYGQYLSVFFIGRLDQIHFKLYAAVDRNDYHVQDLFALDPTEEEMEKAAIWTVTQDVSETFKSLLKQFLEIHGYGVVAERI
jgi:hypothetical protein